MMWTYIAVVVFFLGWFIADRIAAQQARVRDSMAIVEPFGSRAFAHSMRYLDGGRAQH